MADMLAKMHSSQTIVAQGGAEVARAMRAELKRRAAIAEAGPTVVDITEARRPLGKARSLGELFFGPASTSTPEPSATEARVVLPLRRDEAAATTGQLSQPLKRLRYLAPETALSRHFDGSSTADVIALDRIVTFDSAGLPPMPEPKSTRASGLGAAALAVVMLAAMACIAMWLLRGD